MGILSRNYLVMNLYEQAQLANRHKKSGKNKAIVKYMVRALIHAAQFKRMSAYFHQGNRLKLFEKQPNFVTKCITPYLRDGFTKDQRVDILINHYQWFEQVFTAQAQCAIYQDNVVLCELSIDEERYFVTLSFERNSRKEGELTLSLCDEQHNKYYVIAFTYIAGDFYIGCMQGGANDNGFSRKFTKAFYGLRPKSFMVETVQLLAQLLHIPHLYAVKNSGHIYNAKRYGKKAQTINLNYDQLWEEHDGEVYDEWFYQLPLESKRRAMEDIKRPKRKMYRERYEWLDGYKEQLAQSLEPLLNSSTVK